MPGTQELTASGAAGNADTRQLQTIEIKINARPRVQARRVRNKGIVYS